MGGKVPEIYGEKFKDRRTIKCKYCGYVMMSRAKVPRCYQCDKYQPNPQARPRGRPRRATRK